MCEEKDVDVFITESVKERGEDIICQWKCSAETLNRQSSDYFSMFFLFPLEAGQLVFISLLLQMFSFCPSSKVFILYICRQLWYLFIYINKGWINLIMHYKVLKFMI